MKNGSSVFDFEIEIDVNIIPTMLELTTFFFFSTLRFHEIATGEMMDEADSSNKHSKAEHDSVDFKLKLFQIEKVECDRKY